MPFVQVIYCRQRMIYLTVRFYQATYAFQSESKLYSCLNIKDLLAWNRRDIWNLSDCNGTLTHNHLVCKRTQPFSQTGQSRTRFRVNPLYSCLEYRSTEKTYILWSISYWCQFVFAYWVSIILLMLILFSSNFPSLSSSLLPLNLIHAQVSGRCKQ